MDFKWFGQSCFYISGKKAHKSREKVSILTDPFDESTGLKLYKQNVEVVLVTHDHHDHNNLSAVNDDAFVIDGPGEYEVENTFIQGIFSFHDDEEGEERGVNTIYVIESEGMRTCHLGDFGQEELTDEQMQEIGEVDILLIPVGGNYTIDGKQASKVITQLEPKAVIPMHYKIPGLEVDIEGPEKFLEATGSKDKEPEEKASIAKSHLSDSEVKIIPLEAQSKQS